ncbi:MAG TPA: aminotransferase class III-fold pyridoxal phosphate-dependent enzyme, partial [Anaerolineae bacterium]|nr:aminotransferase class III-fold pyridoxal phosphate-dependent enzyme [Anaerolineae bacterium]
MAFIRQRPKEESIAWFRDHVSSGKAAFFAQYGMEFVPGRREGICLWDVDNEKRLINCHCNGGVFNLGHRHPEVVETLKRAIDELDIGNHHLLSEQRATLGERLAELAPGDLPYSVFAVGGGEAIDFALKLARAHTKRPGIISARGGYHGHTGLALAAGDAQYREPFGPMAPGFVQVPFGDLEAVASQMDGETAAVILETIPATLGMPIAPPDYFAELRALCNERGALLIVDEVQSGLGRTGKLWAIEHWADPARAGSSVEPDILVTGKGLSGGTYPIAATCYRGELNAFLHANPFIHVSTFGGAEVGCAIALKVLELTADPAFLARVNELAERLASGFRHLQDRYPETLVEVRQMGLMIGLVFPDESCGPFMTKLLYEEGLLAIYA